MRSNEPRSSLIVSDVTMPGGVGTHIRDLTIAACGRGWAVAVLLDSGRGSDSIADALQELRVTVHRGPLHPRHSSEDDIRATVLRAIEISRPDIIHVQCGSPKSAILPRQLALDSSIPLLFTENYVSADSINEELLARLKTIYLRAHAVISVCDHNRDLLRNELGLVANHHVVIRYGVRLLPPRPSVRDTRKTICVARLTHQKGIDVLLRAFSLVSHTDIGITLAGSGELDSDLRRMAEELGLGKRVHFAGWVEDIAARLDSSDLFVLPSRSEGQPIALLEALAAGLPSIASAVSGIPEALAGGSYGALVPPEDPRALSTAITAYYDNPTDLRSRVRAARHHLRLHHDPATNLSRVVDLWESAL